MAPRPATITQPAITRACVMVMLFALVGMM
ncbi:hypothetical protein ABID23_000583 [Bartonella silvatica]|uniref:Uncharacterized protein n=1 Tax=Bartonella silvatica TaxID=357760 RepID=A0ABV2HG31_9HYPH